MRFSRQFHRTSFEGFEQRASKHVFWHVRLYTRPPCTTSRIACTGSLFQCPPRARQPKSASRRERSQGASPRTHAAFAEMSIFPGRIPIDAKSVGRWETALEGAERSGANNVARRAHVGAVALRAWSGDQYTAKLAVRLSSAPQASERAENQAWLMVPGGLEPRHGYALAS